ncbi:MAG: fibronectin type III domain-containing protein [Opitutaceae bacterium]|nr:fibronectin type III domain-containing protein [Opitutaceae bacterium]
MYHQRSLRSGFLRALAALVLALVALAGPASAATLIVTTTADSGAGSLPAQIAAAASGDTIVFAPNLSGQTITLTSGTLYISKNLTIDGSALASPIQISGNDTYQVFYIYGECTVAFSHLGIVHGRNTESYGGGIRNPGTLTLTACTLSDNTARNGGGLQNEGTATLTACTFSRNSATIHPNYGYGGGINNSGGTLTLTSCTLFGNSAGDEGGAINNDGGAINNAWLTLTSCTLFDNTAERGGGICNMNLTTVIRSSIVAGNKATLAYPNFEGPITSQGFNLSDNWATYGTIALAGSDLTIASADLKLDGLAGNGGPTKTCALLAGSAAINAGDPDLASGTDQRGVARPQGTGPDIGAYEYDSTAPAFTTVSLASNNGSPALARLGDTLTLTLTASEVLRAPTVTIAGQIATVTGSGTSWLATTTVASGTTEGVAAISILFTDLSGNVGTVVTTTTDSSRVTIDTTVPAAPVFTTASGTTSDTTPTLAGTAEPGITVTLHNSLSLLGTTTADSAGVWSFTPGTAWGDGTHFLLAFATDAAGNESNDFAFLLLTIGASAATTPGAPTAVTAVDGNGFATVSFTAPSIQGAATISSYTVTAWSGGVAVTTATGTTSPITVTGLTNGTAYTFTVAATNSFGTGAASAASNAVTPAIHPRVVTTTADNGTGSLRQAIADTTIAGDPIIFAPGLSGQTITLTSGQLTIAKNLTIDGSALAIPVTISGNSTSRVFHVGPGSIVAFSHLGIVHGSVPAGESGGGIHNEGTLALTACTLSENLATDNGGGIANTGTLTLSACTVSGNSAHDLSTSTDSSPYSQGGGIHNSGTLALTACTLAGNSAQDRAKGVAYGGGIYNSGSLTLTACTLSGNSAAESSAGFGGGILTSGGTLTLTACTLVGNSTNGTNRGMGGGIFASGGTLTLTACTLTGNSAGRTILSGAAASIAAAMAPYSP